MKKQVILNTLRSQMFIGLILFFLLSFLGSVFSGALTLNGIDFRTLSFYLPLFSLDYSIKSDFGIWVGILASSATLAAFLSNYIGKRTFIMYKFVDYPADHLKVLKFIRGNPQGAETIASEFDIPLSVAQRVLEDLEKGGLLEKLGEGEKTIYYFPFEKNQVEREP